MLLAISWLPAVGQHSISGTVFDEERRVKENVEIIIQNQDQRTSSDQRGYFKLNLADQGTYKVLFFAHGYEVEERIIKIQGQVKVEVSLSTLSVDLSEVVITDQNEEVVFNLKRLNPVEGTSIFAGKKSEVVLLNQMEGNKAGNNARQIYSQIAGLNIYESSDAGLQLNIGGRGLDPNRTSNFNTRQNGYDISADYLGYPESYYTPPAEALQEIQIVRGAASLQYGTQFGGLLNFIMKKPISDKKIQLVSRLSTGSYQLLTSFNSLSGTIGKFSYYTYYHYKQGDGYRPHSMFSSNNFYSHLNYRFNNKTEVSLDYTHLKYIAQQPGGLTDSTFNANPTFSNRSRNWFAVDWNLLTLQLTHRFSSQSQLSASIFGLYASRSALGYRGNPIDSNINPVSQEDPKDEFGEYIYNRDLIIGNFKNFGSEVKFLTRYKLGNNQSVFLIGSKFYQSQNTSQQGPGSIGSDQDFTIVSDQFPNYPNQSDFKFPNLNVSLFAENIFSLSDKWSLTPGIRFEYIRTASEGTYNEVLYDNAQNPIANNLKTDQQSFKRSFILMGMGLSYVPNSSFEFYANFSQNYRSVTFDDIRVANPTFIVDPNISDEQGYTADSGIRGNWKNMINYDLGLFGLLYNDRIGIILDERANRVRKNIGKAFIYGAEIFADVNLLNALNMSPGKYKVNIFINTAITESKYLTSEENNVKGKKVEFIPLLNFKTGVNFGYQNLQGSLQWVYLSDQFTDVENSPIAQQSDNRSGLIGEIPSYNVMDFSLSYYWKHFRFETGINNLLNKSYFTRRATGYPGPGIIPSERRTFFFTLEFKI